MSEYLPTEADLSELTEVEQWLSEKGYAWHSLGQRWMTGVDGKVRIWFNGSCAMGTAGLTRQPSGWFTLDEMRRETFAVGCRGG